MKTDYFGEMCKWMGLSVAVLFVSTFVLKLMNPFISMPAAIAPLAIYHLRFLVPKVEQGLSQSAIDSVYYFGFLITIFALCFSAITVGQGGVGSSVDTVVLQFGTGLFATAYAVVARMHLQSKAAHMTDVSMEVIMDKYVKKSMELVANVDAASIQLAAFSKEIVAKTIEASELTRQAAEEKMLDVAEAFSDEMSSMTESARSSLHDMRTFLNSTAFVAERQQYIQSIKETASITTELNKALVDLSAKTKEEVGTMQQAVVASNSATTSMHQFSLQIRGMSGSDGDLAQSARMLSYVTQEISAAHTAVAGMVTDLQGFAGGVADTGPAFKNMRAITKRVIDQLDTLGEASERLTDAVENISGAAQASTTVAGDLRKIAAIVPALSASTEAFAANLDRAGAASGSFDKDLSKLPKHIDAIESFGARIVSAMERISTETERALAQSGKLSEHRENTFKAVDGANQLLESAAGLQVTVASLQTLFGDLGASISTVQTSLLASSNDLKHKLADSSQALDDDLKRSSSAAAQLVERLSQATDIITRHGQEANQVEQTTVKLETA